MSRVGAHSPDWTPMELRAVVDFPRYARANYKAIRVLHRRSKFAIACKRRQLRREEELSRGAC